MDLTDMEYNPVAGFCENSNEHKHIGISLLAEKLQVFQRLYHSGSLFRKCGEKNVYLKELGVDGEIKLK